MRRRYVTSTTQARPGVQRRCCGTNTCPAHPGSPSEDYEHATGTLTFAPGQITKTVTVAVCGDDQQEPDETLTFTLTGPVNATLGIVSAAGAITDNDMPPALIPT